MSTTTTTAVTTTTNNTTQFSLFGRTIGLYPRWYSWFVFLSAMDIMFTWVVLTLGGREVNAFADRIIQSYGILGAISLKLAVIGFVLANCEIIGRYKPSRGRFLSRAAVAITAFPVIAAFAQLAVSEKTDPRYWESEEAVIEMMDDLPSRWPPIEYHARPHARFNSEQA